ncbi:2,6-beta-D-fructofuranosidase [bacterium]|nr:2,6-beta-D-fructofuranosidase [bacterium]
MIRTLILTLAVFAALHPAPGYDGPEILIADFEGENYGSWKVTGEAFGTAPARGTLPGQMAVSGFEGRGLVNSFRGGDSSTGTLTSPEFRLERKFLRFLIGGGRDEARLRITLNVGGKVVRTMTGPNASPGGSEALALAGWEVGEYQGQAATIRIEDQATGGWGHINVDQIVLTDIKPPMPLKDVFRELTASDSYLLMPVKNGSPKRKVSVFVDGQEVVRNDIELADGEPDWWAPMEIVRWKGKRLKIVVDSLPGDSKALASIDQSDQFGDETSLYHEPLRGQLHFSPRRGWNNDPNGLVYFGGEYHMFFQHNPYGWGWGNMHWGHAVSRDLVHWQELGDVLWPDKFGPMFSGSAVVDHANASGLGTKEKPPMVLFYTAAGDPTVQCVASSTDGRTFSKYLRNPVIGQVTGGNRDPKVIWHEPSERWVKVLYVEKPQSQHTIHFFVSENLIDWKLASIFDGDKAPGRFMFECPDFFPLAVDDDPAKSMWVLMAADGQYALGRFDGTTFTALHSRLQSQQGRGFYAAQTFSDIPKEDGRRIRIGWWQTETRGMPFNQSMTLPHEMKLVSTPDGPRITNAPVRELESLRGKKTIHSNLLLNEQSANPLKNFEADLAELKMRFEPGRANATIDIRGAEIVVDPVAGTLKVQDHVVPLPKSKVVDLVIYCDRTGLEIFANGGQVYVPFPFQPKSENQRYSVKANGGEIRFESIEAYSLNSIWPPAQ